MLFKYINTYTNSSDKELHNNSWNQVTTHILIYLLLENLKKTTAQSLNLYNVNNTVEYGVAQHHLQGTLNMFSNLNKTLVNWLIPYKLKKQKFKKKRIYINFHKWKTIKNLIKKNKITKTINRSVKPTNIRTRIAYQIKPSPTNFRKNYKNLRFKTKQQFTQFFKIWTRTGQSQLTDKSIYKKTSPVMCMKKQFVMSTFINYILNHSVKKRLLKKLKRRLGIKSGSFIRSRNVRLYHNWTTKTIDINFCYTNSNSLNTLFYKKINIIEKLQNQKNATALKLTTSVDTSIAFSHKKAFFEALFKSSHDSGIYKSYLNNTPLLNTFFTLNRYNRPMFENWNTLQQRIATPSNLLDLRTVNNYTPISVVKQVLSNTGVQRYQTLNNIASHSQNATSAYFYVQFVLTFLEKYTKKKIWLRLNTKTQLNQFWLNYCTMFNNTQSFHIKKLYKLINTQELLEIFIQTLITCDLKILLFFIKLKLENTHFKNHKKILSILFDTFKKNKAALALSGVKGFSFDIRGKVGVAGNAKKRHLFFSMGKISTTSQNLKAQWQQINVWTPTGQMGVTCLIQY